jgi:hypothetical protein
MTPEQIAASVVYAIYSISTAIAFAIVVYSINDQIRARGYYNFYSEGEPTEEETKNDVVL